MTPTLATTMTTEWFSRYGGKVTRVHDVDLAKGTAKHTYQDRCARCGGAGASDKWIFTGRVCFDCHGTGKGNVRTENVYTAEKLAKLNAAQAVRDVRKAEKAQAKAAAAKAEADAVRQSYYDAHRDVLEPLEAFVKPHLDVPVTSKSPVFLVEMWRTFERNGKLSEKQLEATRKSLAREMAWAAAKAGSQHVGEIGKRIEMTLTVERVIHLDNDGGGYAYHAIRFAPPTIYLCRDEQGNRIVYKGTGDFPAKGETAKVKATINEHNERDGEKQTLISRPKVLETLSPAEPEPEEGSAE
jgi:hypothetical protein